MKTGEQVVHTVLKRRFRERQFLWSYIDRAAVEDHGFKDIWSLSRFKMQKTKR